MISTDRPLVGGSSCIGRLAKRGEPSQNGSLFVKGRYREAKLAASGNAARSSSWPQPGIKRLLNRTLHAVKTVEYSELNISNILLLVTSVIGLLPTKITPPVQSSNTHLHVQKSHLRALKAHPLQKDHSRPRHPAATLPSQHAADPPEASPSSHSN